MKEIDPDDLLEGMRPEIPDLQNITPDHIDLTEIVRQRSEIALLDQQIP